MDIEDIKNKISSYPRPFDVVLPRYEKGSDCIAAPICKHIGNLRKSCMKGFSSPIPTANFSKCVEGIVILLGSIAGINLEPPPPDKKVHGFAGQPPEVEEK